MSKKSWVLALVVLSGTLVAQAAVAQLIGPVDPPPGGVVASETGTPNDGSWGRVGGKTWSYSSLIHADRSDKVYWGVDTGGVKLSLDGFDYSAPGEIMAYDAGLSDLPNGIAVWSGQTTIITMNSGPQTAYSRLQVTATLQGTSTPIPMVLATDEGLNVDVGGLVPIATSATAIDVNLLFTASLNQNGPYLPHLDFFDPLTDFDQDGQANSSVEFGFYYVNTPPFLVANVNNVLDEGTSTTITMADLAADDYESDVTNITFSVDPDVFGGTPQNGQLLLNGVPLGSLDTFTQDDIDNSLLTYAHDGSETTFDSFTFSVTDEEGALAVDGPFTVFQHNFNINPVNDPPVAIDGSGTAGLDGIFNGTFEASDADSVVLTFIVVNVDEGDVQLQDANLGTFTYTSTPPFVGDAVITFQVTDGLSLSAVPGTFIVTVPDPADAIIDPGDLLIGDGDKVILHNFPADTEYVIASGDNLSDLTDVTTDIYERIFVLDRTAGLFEIDPDTGVQTQIATGDNFNPNTPGSIAAENEDSLLVAEVDTGVRRVDIATGVLTPLSTGGLLPVATAVGIDANGAVYASDASAFTGGDSALVEVDPGDGSQSLVTSGDLLAVPVAVATEPDGQVLVADNGAFLVPPSSNKVIRINPVGGGQSALAEGDNIELAIADVAVSEGGAIYVAAREQGIVEVSALDGTQSLVATGDDVVSPSAVAVFVTSVIIFEDGFESGDTSAWSSTVP
jgi:hypothetical protein